MSDPARGRFCWYDLMTTDPEAAMGFYGEVVGWGTELWEGGQRPYTMWTNQGTAIGGVMPLPEDAVQAGAPPHWLAYVAVPEVDASVAQVTELGGGIMVPPMDIPTVGRFAVITDPQGAAIALFTAEGEAPGHDGLPNRGEISWHELVTTDYKAALRFYQALFGWEGMDAADMGPLGMYQMYGRSGLPIGGMFNKPAEMAGPPLWLYYALVDDVRRVTALVEQRGGTVLNGPMEVPGGDLVAQCLDPQGAGFAIHSLTRDD